ncbi:MAG: 1-deoxy-D-xylulose-5-phosphate reductoisomerase [Hominilimicola sp.]
MKLCENKMEFEHKISVLGSTGSIGTQTLEIAREYKGISIETISAHSNIDLLEKQAREFKPKLVCVTNEEKAKDLKIRLADTDIKVVSGRDGLNEAATIDGAKTVVTAVVGISGLEPTIEAIKAKKNIALANKETLVTGGHIVTRLAKENGIKILPVDSEHSAIFQSLQGCNDKREIKNILLTASGGPFFGKTIGELQNITPADALKHPNWNMGTKVTIDSSTLVNKGLEVIEAKWLFGTENIKVLVHRQSVVHSMVEFVDNGVIAQLGVPDMRLPIQYALTYPNRLPMKNNELNLVKCSSLTFEEPDMDTFYALRLAFAALRDGGIKPTVFNSADEAAVELFMKGKLSYLGISEAIDKAMREIKNIDNPDIDTIFETDRLAREIVYSM